MATTKFEIEPTPLVEREILALQDDRCDDFVGVGFLSSSLTHSLTLFLHTLGSTRRGQYEKYGVTFLGENGAVEKVNLDCLIRQHWTEHWLMKGKERGGRKEATGRAKAERRV